jgi:hypothetical protein
MQEAIDDALNDGRTARLQTSLQSMLSTWRSASERINEGEREIPNVLKYASASVSIWERPAS